MKSIFSHSQRHLDTHSFLYLSQFLRKTHTDTCFCFLQTHTHAFPLWSHWVFISVSEISLGISSDAAAPAFLPWGSAHMDAHCLFLDPHTQTLQLTDLLRIQKFTYTFPPNGKRRSLITAFFHPPAAEHILKMWLNNLWVEISKIERKVRWRAQKRKTFFVRFCFVSVKVVLTYC